jgi:broad specificity phosphatase PhoE
MKSRDTSPLPYHTARPHRTRQSLRTTVFSALVFLTVTVAVLFVMKEAPDSPPTTSGVLETPNDVRASWFRIESVPGYFAQADPKTNASQFSWLTANFGLVSRSYTSDSSYPSEKPKPTQWERFYHHLAALNSDAPPATSYRLFFLGRHGQGYHNVAETFYSTIAWDCYFSTLDGNGTVTWKDAHLTPVGRGQARTASEFWDSQIQDQRMTTPDSYYISPMDRAIETADITFRNLKFPEGSAPYNPLIKEMLRETNGIHTCDERSPLSVIRSRWHDPPYRIEKGFTEKDELWNPDLRESASAHTARMLHALDDILRSDDSTIISLTVHSGVIAAILRGVGHREFIMETGGVIPVLVKVEEVAGERPHIKTEPWQPKPECPPDFKISERDASEDAFKSYLKSSGGISIS